MIKTYNILHNTNVGNDHEVVVTVKFKNLDACELDILIDELEKTKELLRDKQNTQPLYMDSKFRDNRYVDLIDIVVDMDYNNVMIVETFKI